MTSLATGTAAAAAASAINRPSDLWKYCLPCCRANKEPEDGEDTKLCQITLNLNCCANHNNIHTVTTDGATKADDQEAEEEEDDDEEDGNEENNVSHRQRQNSSKET